MTRAYDNRVRAVRAEARKLKLRLDAEKKATRGPKSPEGRPRAERRREQRARLLPADRICPSCGEINLESRKWVVISSVLGRPAKTAVCLSCFRTGAYLDVGDTTAHDGPPVGGVEHGAGP